jgi:hypothetical protein
MQNSSVWMKDTMNFKVWLEGGDLIPCEFCGSKNFKRVAGRKLSDVDTEGGFVFYECSGCRGMGFWTHSKTVDGTGRILRAISKEVFKKEGLNTEEPRQPPTKFDRA